MNESLLQFIWLHKFLLNKPLTTTQNQTLEILHPGTLNLHAGPDFFNARIKIGSTQWAGNIEIHTTSSLWQTHKHNTDRAYDNVILHVVYHCDKEITTPDGNIIPTLELKSYIPPLLLNKYQKIMNAQQPLACSNVAVLPDEIKIKHWLNRLAIERLASKTEEIKLLLSQHNNHWQQVFFITLCRYFGQKINDEPMLLLAQQIPLSCLAKQKDNLLSLQALFLGVAGFLNQKPTSTYLYSLHTEFKHLSAKFNLISLPVKVWKFGKTRPANFPTIRLMQLAQLIYSSEHLFKKSIEAKDLNELRKLYDIKTNQLFNFSGLNKHLTQAPVSINTGKIFTESILLNVVIPLTFEYGKQQNNEAVSQKVLDWLDELKAENNKIIRNYEVLNLKAANAKESQAMIHWFKNYCSHKKCLSCVIGHQILSYAN